MKHKLLHFGRRLGAIFYDCLLLSSVLFFSTLVLLVAMGGQMIASNNIFYDLYLLSLSYLYFTWQWTHGGQTLGMRAWQLRLYQDGQQCVRWGRATLRFFLSILSWLMLGSGFLWALVDSKSRALHDRVTNTFPEFEG